MLALSNRAAWLALAARPPRPQLRGRPCAILPVRPLPTGIRPTRGTGFQAPAARRPPSRPMDPAPRGELPPSASGPAPAPPARAGAGASFAAQGGRSEETATAAGKERVRLVIIGDVHRFWDAPREIAALKHLQADIIVFVGDFGEEDVALVGEISRVQGQLGGPRVAVILGNHDAWHALQRLWGKASPGAVGEEREDAIQAQQALLGDCDVGYGRIEFPEWRLFLVGGRPFSYGPSSFRKEFYQSRFGISSLSESARRIVEVAVEGMTPAQLKSQSFLLLAHNGPSGLGCQPFDICGRDFPSKNAPPNGDFGDADLAAALLAMTGAGLRVPLVMFGHMHHRIRGGDLRKMLAVGTPLVHPESLPESVWSDMKQLKRDLLSSHYSGSANCTAATTSTAAGIGKQQPSAHPQGHGAAASKGAVGEGAAGSGVPTPDDGRFGDMSLEEAASGGPGEEFTVDGRIQTVHVNAAVVPRLRRAALGLGGSGSAGKQQEGGAKVPTEHHFVVVEYAWGAGVVEVVEDVWVCVGGTGVDSVLNVMRERRFQHGVVQENGGFVYSAG